MTEIEFISEERLRKYISLSNTPATAVILHNQTLRLGASIMSMIAMIELALRNATNETCIRHFQSDSWLTNATISSKLSESEQSHIGKARKQAQRAIYAKKSFKEKATLDDVAFPNGVPHNLSERRLKASRIETIPVTHGQIIAQTTIAFWKRLYSADYENLLWKPCLKRVFPDKKIKRNEISKNL